MFYRLIRTFTNTYLYHSRQKGKHDKSDERIRGNTGLREVLRLTLIMAHKKAWLAIIFNNRNVRI